MKVGRRSRTPSERAVLARTRRIRTIRMMRALERRMMDWYVIVMRFWTRTKTTQWVVIVRKMTRNLAQHWFHRPSSRLTTRIPQKTPPPPRLSQNRSIALSVEERTTSSTNEGDFKTHHLVHRMMTRRILLFFLISCSLR